jgi:hypothetical protein
VWGYAPENLAHEQWYYRRVNFDVLTPSHCPYSSIDAHQFVSQSLRTRSNVESSYLGRTVQVDYPNVQVEIVFFDQARRGRRQIGRVDTDVEKWSAMSQGVVLKKREATVYFFISRSAVCRR